MLRVTLEDSGENVVLHCVGKMVRGQETALLCAAARQHRRSIVIDLSQVETIDAAGLGALIALQAAGIYLQLLNPAPSVLQVLQVTHLDTVFEICTPSSEQIQDENSSQPVSSPTLAAMPAIYSGD